MPRKYILHERYIGFETSAGAGFNITDHMGIEFNLGYLAIGGQGDRWVPLACGVEGYKLRMKAKVHFLTLSILMRRYIPLKKNLSLFVGVGPKFHRLLSYTDILGLFSQWNNEGLLNRDVFSAEGVFGVEYLKYRTQLQLYIGSNAYSSKLVEDFMEGPTYNKIRLGYTSVMLAVGYGF